jgi:hypothetical protein
MTGETPRLRAETARAKALEEERRAAALRENLKRRKLQQRQRESDAQAPAEREQK